LLSHAALAVSTLPWAPSAQLALRQPVPLGQARQAPEPLHVPSLSQWPLATSLFAQRPLGSESPLSTSPQSPFRVVAVPLQVLHKPEAPSAQALTQQTPSVQKPLWHWMPWVHAAPFIFKPQLLLAQVFGVTQSASLVQVVLQASVAQMKVSQVWVAGVMQAPSPSQVEAGMTEDVSAQMAALQLVTRSW
jgi:hypothetical protein